MFDEKLDLRIPGPTPVPARVLQRTTKPLINHRGPTFHALFPDILERLKYVFQTDSEIHILTGSGTAGMEAAVANVVSEGDTVIVPVGGAFGQRWVKICSRYGARVVEIKYPWGTAVDPAEIAAVVGRHPEAKAVFTTHNESSTGVVNDIQGIAKAVRDASKDGDFPLIAVDAVSSLGGVELKTDEWGLDIVVTASQKCLMLPPGLAMVSTSERAKRAMRESNAPKFYFDLSSYSDFAAQRETPFTPNVQLILALDEALAMIEEEGLPAIFERHLLMRDMVRKAVTAIGFELVVEDRYASPTVTAVWCPENLKLEALRNVMREEFGVEIAGGQGELAGKTFRIGHMGYSTPMDMIKAISGLELTFELLAGRDCLGVGVRTAQEFLLESKFKKRT